MTWTESWWNKPGMEKINSICITGTDGNGERVDMVFDVRNNPCEITTEINYESYSHMPVNLLKSCDLSIKGEFRRMYFSKSANLPNNVSDDELMSLLEG